MLRYKPAVIVTSRRSRRLRSPSPGGVRDARTSDRFKQKIREPGQDGERVWETAALGRYCDLIKSDIADMKNAGGRDERHHAACCSRSSCRSTLGHLDIAARPDRQDRPYTPKAPRASRRLLTQFLRDYEKGEGKMKKVGR